MKFFVSLAASIVAAAVILSLLPVHGEEQIYDSVIRLHVLAESDREEDQAVKLAVRDHLLAQLAPLMSRAETVEEAAAILTDNLDTLEAGTAAWLAENGRQDTVRICLTEEHYPTRQYDSFTLPAGEYLSLRVILGSGEGKNWWCVLFPSVCGRFAVKETEQAYREAGFTPEQYRLITHTGETRYHIRFRLLELWTEWFHGAV